MSKTKKRRKKQKTDEELLTDAVTDLRAWRASRRAWPDTPPGSLAGQRAAALDRVLDAVENGHRIRRPPQPGPASYAALRDATDTLHDFLSSTAGPRAFQFAIDVSTSRGYPTNGGETTTTPPAPEIDPATGEPLEEVRLTPTEAAANAPDRDALRATVALAKADDITRDIRKLLERLTAYRHDRPTEACSSCGTAIPHGRTRCPAADCQTSTQTRPDTCSDCDDPLVPGKTRHGRCDRCRKDDERTTARGDTYIPRNQRPPAHIATVDAIQLDPEAVIATTEDGTPFVVTDWPERHPEIYGDTPVTQKAT